MTCYFRHLREIFEQAGVTVTSENKQSLDKTIHQIVKTRYKNCPQTWKEVKKRIAQDQEGFASALKEAWNRHE